MNSETGLSEDSDAAFSDSEPAVLSYVQSRNRECLLAWRQRRREHEAARDKDGAVQLNGNRSVRPAANPFARAT